MFYQAERNEQLASASIVVVVTFWWRCGGAAAFCSRCFEFSAGAAVYCACHDRSNDELDKKSLCIFTYMQTSDPI